MGPRTQSSSSENGTLFAFPYTSLVEAISVGLRFLTTWPRTISVPRILVSIVRTGLSTIWNTPTEAARWTTTSAESTNSATRGPFRIVSTTRRYRGFS